jgi:hypothetical protein
MLLNATRVTKLLPTSEIAAMFTIDNFFPWCEFIFWCLASAGGARISSIISNQRRGRERPNAPTAWHVWGAKGLCWLAFAVWMGLPNPYSSVSTHISIALLAWSGVCFAVAAWKFFKQQRQFAIWTLPLLALAVAVLCSVAHYIPSSLPNQISRLVATPHGATMLEIGSWQYSACLLAFAAGNIAALVISSCDVPRVWCNIGFGKTNTENSATEPPNTPSTWYFHASQFAYFLAIAVFLAPLAFCLGAADGYFVLWLVVCLACSGICIVKMVRTFFEARQQFTIRTLLIVTFAVALLCSIAHYISLVPIAVLLVLLLAPPANEWPMRRAARVRRALARAKAKSIAQASDVGGGEPGTLPPPNEPTIGNVP